MKRQRAEISSNVISHIKSAHPIEMWRSNKLGIKEKISRGKFPRLIFSCPVPSGLPHRSHCVPMNMNPWNYRVFTWSCWADSNCRPHPYQEIFGVFYNNFRLFLVVFIPNNVVSRTFVKCSLRCFHACLWWNCGQPAICVDSACANRIDSASQITPQFLRKSI